MQRFNMLLSLLTLFTETNKKKTWKGTKVEEYCSDRTCSTCGEVQILCGLRRMSVVRAAECCALTSTNTTPQAYITTLNNSLPAAVMPHARC